VNPLRQRAAVHVLVAAVALLPFARGLLSGQSFFYRDLAQVFFPLRRFIVEGLRQGELRYWNPYVHEGEPLTLLPVGYLPDLLQVLIPNERGFSLLLALHVALAALTFMALARGLGLGLLAAAGGALVYALGGFCLSSLNLYVHLQAVAWAPLVVLGLLRAAGGGGRECVQAALACAVALSTTSVEVAGQAFVFAAALSLSRARPRAGLRLAGAVALGGGLAAVPLLVMTALAADSARSGGLPTAMVLAYSIHPMTFLQVVVAGLYGDLSDYVNRFWGGLFFSGLPYFSSLYLGLLALALAAVGVREGRAWSVRLVLLALAAVLVSLGPRIGLDRVLEAVPALRVFRFPTKAFFTVHFAAAVLAAHGLESLGRDRRPWRSLALLCLVLGALLAAAPALPWVLPGPVHDFLAAFFPPTVPWPRRYEQAQLIVHDAARGGVVALAAGGLSLLVVAGRVRTGWAAVGVVALVAADLLRTGTGLNPMVTPAFFELSPEMSGVVAALKAEGGRVFTCEPLLSPAYLRARMARVGRHEVWMPAVFRETLTPDFNMNVAVASAYSQDLTMLVPPERVLSPATGGCSAFESIAERLRTAGVAHVLSLDDLVHPALALRAVVQPASVSPLAIRVYALRDPLPLRAVSAAPQGRVIATAERAGAIRMEVEADGPGAVVVRDAYAAGWRAWVNGVPTAVSRADGHHREVAVPAGRSAVELRYRPPRLVAGLVITLTSAAIAALLWRSSLDPRGGGA
jgi:hypothetical protein